jgi:hypothetical protein
MFNHGAHGGVGFGNYGGKKSLPSFACVLRSSSSFIIPTSAPQLSTPSPSTNHGKTMIQKKPLTAFEQSDDQPKGEANGTDNTDKEGMIVWRNRFKKEEGITCRIPYTCYPSNPRLKTSSSLPFSPFLLLTFLSPVGPAEKSAATPLASNQTQDSWSFQNPIDSFHT